MIDWVLKYDYDTNEALKKIQYPSPDSTGPLSYQHASPVKVLYTLPSYVYLTPNDTLRVAAWDVNISCYDKVKIFSQRADGLQITLMKSNMTLKRNC